MGEGTGAPLVLIHGFGADLNNWMFNQTALAEDHIVYAVDLPGHGGSTKEVGSGDVAAMTAALADFLDAVAIERAHLVGHSLGAAVALDLALTRPERVASLTLIACAALGPEINKEFIDGFIKAGRRKQLKPVLEMLVHDPALIGREMIDDVLKYKRLDGAAQALERIAAACFPGGRQALNLADGLARLTMPVAGDLGPGGPNHPRRPRGGPAGDGAGPPDRRRRPHGPHGEGRRSQRPDPRLRRRVGDEERSRARRNPLTFLGNTVQGRGRRPISDCGGGGFPTIKCRKNRLTLDIKGTRKTPKNSSKLVKNSSKPIITH